MKQYSAPSCKCPNFVKIITLAECVLKEITGDQCNALLTGSPRVSLLSTLSCVNCRYGYTRGILVYSPCGEHICDITLNKFLLVKREYF